MYSWHTIRVIVEEKTDFATEWLSELGLSKRDSQDVATGGSVVGGGMQYGAGIFAGIASSALFWLLDKYLLTLPQSYHIGGMIACFVVFGGAGYWLALRVPKEPGAAVGTRIATNLKGRNIKVSVDDVTATGGGGADIISDVEAKGDIEADAKNIRTKP